MKRFLILSIALITTLACSLSGTQTPPLTVIEPASAPETSAPTELTPATAPSNDAALLYISGTTHIETKPQTWPDVDAYLAFLQQVTDLGMRWSVGADIGWLEGEPRAAELIQKSEAIGVQWDIHTHNMNDRAKAAYLITQMGGHPNTVISGMLISEFDAMLQPLSYQGFTWTPQVLWGGTQCPGHRSGCDVDFVGLWSPTSGSDYFSHNPNSDLVHVGGGTHYLDAGRKLAQAIANGEYSYPIISFTVMVAPSTLQVTSTGEGIEEITAFVNEMNTHSFVHWATIEETAQAWVKAGSVLSRLEIP